MKQLDTHMATIQQQLDQLAATLSVIGRTLKTPQQQANLEVCWTALTTLHETHAELLSQLQPARVQADSSLS